MVRACGADFDWGICTARLDNMIILKNERDLEAMRPACTVAGAVLDDVAVRPYRRGHGGPAAGEVLNQLIAALSPAPGGVRERHAEAVAKERDLLRNGVLEQHAEAA